MTRMVPQGPMESSDVQSSSGKTRRPAIAVPSRDRAMRPGLNVHHRIHPLHVLIYTMSPSFQVEKGKEKVDAAPHPSDLIFQASDVVVFSGRSKVTVVHARVLSDRIRVGTRVETLGMQSECRMW